MLRSGLNASIFLMPWKPQQASVMLPVNLKRKYAALKLFFGNMEAPYAVSAGLPIPKNRLLFRLSRLLQ
jgi:hypothetical protein